MSKNKYLIEIMDYNPDAVAVDGFDDCIVGIVDTFEGTKLLYSERKIVDKLKKDMTEEEAVEYFDYNILGSYVGEYTPVYSMDLD